MSRTRLFRSAEPDGEIAHRAGLPFPRVRACHHHRPQAALLVGEQDRRQRAAVRLGHHGAVPENQRQVDVAVPLALAFRQPEIRILLDGQRSPVFIRLASAPPLQPAGLPGWIAGQRRHGADLRHRE